MVVDHACVTSAGGRSLYFSAGVLLFLGEIVANTTVQTPTEAGVVGAGAMGRVPVLLDWVGDAFTHPPSPPPMFIP